MKTKARTYRLWALRIRWPRKGQPWLTGVHWFSGNLNGLDGPGVALFKTRTAARAGRAYILAQLAAARASITPVRVVCEIREEPSR